MSEYFVAVFQSVHAKTAAAGARGADGPHYLPLLRVRSRLAMEAQQHFSFGYIFDALMYVWTYDLFV